MPAGVERGASAPPTAARPAVAPGLDEVRALAREHIVVPLRHTFIDDCETPVAAYLKLRGEGPSFLLESGRAGTALRALVVRGSAPADDGSSRRRGSQRGR
jgi:hypothetical protein